MALNQGVWVSVCVPCPKTLCHFPSFFLSLSSSFSFSSFFFQLFFFFFFFFFFFNFFFFFYNFFFRLGLRLFFCWDN